MSLQAATSLFDDDEPGDGIPRHKGDGRPKVWPAGVKPGAVGTKGEYYTRASGLGSCLEDGWAIHQARTRKIVFGMGRSRGLFDLAQAVENLEDTAQLDTIVDDAARLGGDGDAAMSGTALHLLSERADRGDDLAYLDDRMRAAVEAWRRLMSHFTIHGTEQFVVNDELKAAGSYDRLVSPLGLMRAPDGTPITPNDRIGLDLKSGKHAEYFGPTYKVQQVVYFGDGATPYSHEHGRGDWPDLIPPRADWSLIPHVPLDRPDEARFYWVDLAEAAELAQLAVEVRRRRKGKGLPAAELPELGVLEESGPRLAAVPDIPVAGARVTVNEVVALLRAASSRAELDALYDEHAAVWTSFCTAVARRRVEELGAVPVGG